MAAARQTILLLIKQPPDQSGADAIIVDELNESFAVLLSTGEVMATDQRYFNANVRTESLRYYRVLHDHAEPTTGPWWRRKTGRSLQGVARVGRQTHLSQHHFRARPTAPNRDAARRRFQYMAGLHGRGEARRCQTVFVASRSRSGKPESPAAAHHQAVAGAPHTTPRMCDR